MRFDSSRLRLGEVTVGLSSVVLLVLMFLVPWYGLSGEAARTAAALGVSTSVTGWDGLTVVRWLMLVTVVAGLGLTVLQGTRRAPALPVSLSVIVTVLGALTAVVLVYRVLINVPGPDSLVSAQVGGYLGLISAAVLTVGAFRSLRVEDPPAAAKASIRTVELGREG